MASETEKIEVLLRAQYRDFQRGMDKVDRRLVKFEREAGRATTRAGRQIDRNLATIGPKISALVLNPLTAAGAAMGLVANQAAQTVRGIASIGDEARRSGLGVEEFQQLSYVADQSRIPVDALIDGMKELNLRADEFVTTGAGPAAEAFQRLNLGATDLAEKLEDPKELLLDIIDRMEGLDRAAQIRVADEVFGGTGGERFVELLAQGDDGIRRMIARADELGLVIESETVAKAAELDRKFAEITKRVATLAKTVTVNLASSIEDALTIDVDEIFGSAERAIAMLGEENYRSLREAKEITEAQIDTVEDLQNTYEGLFRAINSATGPGGIRLMDVADVEEAHALAAILQDIESEMSAFKTGEIGAADFEASVADAVEEARDLLAELGDVDAQRFGNVISAVDAISAALATAIRKAAEYRAAMPGGDTETSVTYGPQNGRPRYNSPGSDIAPRSSARPQLPSVNHSFGVPDPEEGSGGGMSAAERQAQGYARALKATREEIAQLEAETASLAMGSELGREFGETLDFARKRAELLVEAQKAGREVTPKLKAEIDALALAYSEAGAEAESAAEEMALLEEHARRGADALTDMFSSILDGSRTAGEALGGLLRQIAQAQLSRGVSTLFGKGGPFGGFGSALGSLLSPVPSYASGTPSHPGGLARINEGGRGEIVDLPNGTRVIPHDISSRMAAVAARSNDAPARVGSTGPEQIDVRVSVDDEGALRAYVKREGARVEQRAVARTTRSIRDDMRHQPKSDYGLA